MPTTPPDSSWLGLDESAGVLTITLTNPARLNAINREMTGDLVRVLDWVDQADSVTAVVLTGSGKAFCAGADLTDKTRFGDPADPPPNSHPMDQRRDAGGQLALRLFESSKPVVAAVNGDAVGLGMSMLLPMDVRLAVPSARFGLVQVRRGIALEGCASWFLPRLVGPGRAVELAVSGRLIDAAEARAAGLVDAVHEPDEIVDAARERARAMTAASAPVSAAVTRRMIWQALTFDHPMLSHRMETDIVRHLGTLPDAQEGIRSFRERRPADFHGSPREQVPQFARWWPNPAFDPDNDPTHPVS